MFRPGGAGVGSVTASTRRAEWRQAYALFTGDVAYVWHGALHGDVVGGGLAACGFELRAQIVWAKPHFTLGRGHYHWRNDTCCYAVREGKPGHWQGGRKQTTVWEIANNNPFGNRQREQSWGHTTQKPVECMRRPIVNNSRPGELVADRSRCPRCHGRRRERSVGDRAPAGAAALR